MNRNLSRNFADQLTASLQYDNQLSMNICEYLQVLKRSDRWNLSITAGASFAGNIPHARTTASCGVAGVHFQMRRFHR